MVAITVGVANKFGVIFNVRARYKFMRYITAAIIAILFILSSLAPALAQEENGLTLSITPPLIKSNVNPGQVWKSAIKITNNNTDTISVYFRVVDFRSGSERGTVEFIKDVSLASPEEKNYLLSQWINIEGGPVAIPPLESREIPFVIDIPATAGPGGHYAAILAGTKPPEKIKSGTSIKVSSLLASLILLTIGGDVKEQGSIREFSTDKIFYTEPKVDFTVRFANTGNVHIQPRGEIQVFDYFGNKRGRIIVNHSSDFGNVLPGGIRRWNFSWRGEKGIFGMGRYKALLVLSYGQKAHETVDRLLYFWIIYPRVLIIFFGTVLLLLLAIILFVRRYVKKTIVLTRESVGSGQFSSPSAGGGKQYGWNRFKKAVAAAFLVLLAALAVIFYFHYQSGGLEIKIQEKNEAVNLEQKNGLMVEEAPAKGKEEGTVSVVGNEQAVASTSGREEGKRKGGAESAAISTSTADKKRVEIKVLNGSGSPGMAGKVAEKLEREGYAVAATGNAENFSHIHSMIRYRGGLKSEALAIGELLPAGYELKEDNDLSAGVVVVVGRDFKE